MGESRIGGTDRTWDVGIAEQQTCDVSELLLVVQPGADRRFLSDALDEEYDVSAATDASALDTEFDICIVDQAGYDRYREDIRARKERSETFLPVLLTVDEDSSLRSDPEVWDVVDDVVSVPAPKAELRARVSALRHRRMESLDRREYKEQLRETVADLRVKERAIDAAPIGVTIADNRREDNPVVYVNESFEELTGYPAEEVLDRNCRFLQGPATDEATVDRLRSAIEADEPVSVELTNYERCGRQFWNGLDVAPVEDESGEVTHYVGFQRDVTERKIRDQRLTVLNRVLRHNLRNEIGVVLGFAETLREELDDPKWCSYVDQVTASAAALVELSTSVDRAEKALDRLEDPGVAEPVRELVESVVADLTSDYPDRTVSVTYADRDLPAVPNGVQFAFREAIESALEADNLGDEDVDVLVSRTDLSPNGVEVSVVHGEAALPDSERVVFENGDETPLEHADGLGTWLVDWVVRAAGGTVDVADLDGGGSAISMRFAGLPRSD